MANLSFGVTGPTMDFIVNMQIEDSDAPRILAYLATTEYGIVTENEEIRPATQEETARAFAAGILRGLLDQTVRYEKAEAARIAAEQVPDINPV